jgi:hypothetical protein
MCNELYLSILFHQHIVALRMNLVVGLALRGVA